MPAECVTCFCKIIATASVLHLQDCQGQHFSICVSVDMFSSVLAWGSLSVFVCFFQRKLNKRALALTGSSCHICSASFSQQRWQKHNHIPGITRSSTRKHSEWLFQRKKKKGGGRLMFFNFAKSNLTACACLGSACNHPWA